MGNEAGHRGAESGLEGRHRGRGQLVGVGVPRGGGREPFGTWSAQMVKGFCGQWGGPKHKGPSWGVSGGIGQGNNGARGDSDVSVCGYWILRTNERSKGMKEWIIWYEKYNELGIQRGCVRSSAWVSDVLRIWGQSGI